MNEEKRNLRRAILLIVISIALLTVLAIFGLPLTAKFATFVSDFKNGNKVIQTVDTTPPGPPNLADLPQATNQQSLQISGTSEPLATVLLSLNGTITSTLADKDGNFVFSVNLTKGDNTISAQVKDQAGNVGQSSATYTVTFDNEIPKLDISSPQDGASFYGSKQQTVTITGSTKPGASVTVNDRLVRLNDDGTFSYQFNLNTGDNTLNFSVVDRAGNKTNKSITLHYFE